jgi:hypothetical protein
MPANAAALARSFSPRSRRPGATPRPAACRTAPRRYSRMSTPAVRSFAWWNCWAAAQAQLLAFAGTKESDVHAPPRGALDSADHPAVRDVRVDDIERLARALEQTRDLGGDRPVPAGSVLEDDRRNRVRPCLQEREQAVELVAPNRAPEPVEAGQEEELELRYHRPGGAYELLVEAAVVEVVLDSSAADPADAAVHDHDLAMVDVPEARQVPACRPRRCRGARPAHGAVSSTFQWTTLYRPASCRWTIAVHSSST